VDAILSASSDHPNGLATTAARRRRDAVKRRRGEVAVRQGGTVTDAAVTRAASKWRYGFAIITPCLQLKIVDW
jgi:hypothetical protein